MDRENLVSVPNLLVQTRARSIRINSMTVVKYPPVDITKRGTTKNCTISKLVIYVMINLV